MQLEYKIKNIQKKKHKVITIQKTREKKYKINKQIN